MNAFARNPETGACRIDCITLLPYLQKYDIVLGKSHHDARSIAKYVMAGGMTHPLTRVKILGGDLFAILERLDGDLRLAFEPFVLNKKANFETFKVFSRFVTAEFVERLRAFLHTWGEELELAEVIRGLGRLDGAGLHVQEMVDVVMQETIDAMSDTAGEFSRLITETSDVASKNAFRASLKIEIPPNMCPKDFDICVLAVQTYLVV